MCRLQIGGGGGAFINPSSGLHKMGHPTHHSFPELTSRNTGHDRHSIRGEYVFGFAYYSSVRGLWVKFSQPEVDAIDVY